MDIHERIAKLVESVVQVEGDGTPFFDELDEQLATAPYFNYLYFSILNDPKGYHGILASGKFGWAFSMFCTYREELPPVFNFPGNLRHERLVDPKVDPMFKGRKFVYVDNSIYKGRTLIQVNDYVNNWGGEIVAAHILYDGSRPPHSEMNIVTNMDYVYRWHDEGFRP